jgi:hypothetical protein
MNPNYLLKKELQYELLIRGINSEGDAQTLHKLFRSVYSKSVPVYLSGLSILSVQELYQSTAHKICELQKAVTQENSDPVLLIPQLSTQISHVR